LNHTAFRGRRVRARARARDKSGDARSVAARSVAARATRPGLDYREARLRASRRSSVRARAGARSLRSRVFRAFARVVVDSDAALRELALGARDVSRERLGFGVARREPDHAARDDDDGVQRERDDGVDRGLWIRIRSRARGQRRRLALALALALAFAFARRASYRDHERSRVRRELGVAKRGAPRAQ